MQSRYEHVTKVLKKIIKRQDIPHTTWQLKKKKTSRLIIPVRSQKVNVISSDREVKGSHWSVWPHNPGDLRCVRRWSRGPTYPEESVGGVFSVWAWDQRWRWAPFPSNYTVVYSVWRCFSAVAAASVKRLHTEYLSPSSLGLTHLNLFC